MPTPVEQIKSRLSIVDVVGSYIKLEKAGASYKALCPFHHEKSPSFNVSPSRDAYYCFGCNRGGDIFSFVQEIEGVEFIDALRILAGRAGVELKRESGESKSDREKLFSVMEEAAEFYEKKLSANSAAQKYLKARGLTDQTIRDFRIGFAPLDWRALYTHLREKKFSDADIERAGLVKRADKTHTSNEPSHTRTSGFYDRFRGRIMFPIFDNNGRIVAFSGRIFTHIGLETVRNQQTTQTAPPAKYINSPETPLYDKSSVLFGYNRAKTAIRKQNFVILVEGQMDLIMAHQAGTTNAVAVSGTALTDKHLALLKRLSDNLIFAFDADEAGLHATKRAFELALRAGMNVRVAEIPEGKDPADYIVKNPVGWAEVIANSTHIIDFYLTMLAKRGYDDRQLRKEVERHVLPLVLSIHSKIEQAHFIIEIARKIGVPEASVWEEVKKLQVSHIAAPASEPEPYPERTIIPQKTRRQIAEEEILSIILWQEKNAEPVLDTMLVRQGYHELLMIHGLEPYVPMSDEEQKLIMKAEYTYEHGADLERLTDEILDTLEMEVLREKQGILLKQLAEAEMREAKDEAKKYLQEYQSITPRLIALEDRRVKRTSL